MYQQQYRGFGKLWEVFDTALQCVVAAHVDLRGRGAVRGGPDPTLERRQQSLNFSDSQGSQHMVDAFLCTLWKRHCPLRVKKASFARPRAVVCDPFAAGAPWFTAQSVRK